MRSLSRVSVLLLVLAVFPAQATDRRLTTTYRNIYLGIEFRMPSTWKTHRSDYEPNCIFLISPGYKNTLQIEVVETSLEKSVNEVASGIEFVAGQWIKHGRSSTQPAETMTSNGLTVIYGDGDCLVEDDLGNHTSTCIEALITNGQRTAHLDSNGYPESAVFQILSTFKFIARRANPSINTDAAR